MNLVTKLATCVIVTLLMMAGAVWGFHVLTSGLRADDVVVNIFWYFAANISFGGLVGFAFLFSAIALAVFDLLSILLFYFRFDLVSREMDIYRGVEGSVGPKLSTRTKVLVLYPFAIFVCLLLAVAVTREQLASVLARPS